MTAPGPSGLLATSQRRWMTDCNWWRRVDTVLPSGGVTSTWTQQPGTVAATLVAASTQDRVVAEREDDVASYAVIVPTGSPLTRGDRVSVGGRVVELIASPVYADAAVVARAPVKTDPFDEPLS